MTTAEINGKIIFNINPDTLKVSITPHTRDHIKRQTNLTFNELYPIQNILDVTSKESADQFFKLYEFYLMLLKTAENSGKISGRLDAIEFMEKNVFDLVDYMTKKLDRLTLKIANDKESTGYDVNIVIALSLLTDIAIDRFGTYATLENPASTFYPKPESLVDPKKPHNIFRTAESFESAHIKLNDGFKRMWDDINGEDDPLDK